MKKSQTYDTPPVVAVNDENHANPCKVVATFTLNDDTEKEPDTGDVKLDIYDGTTRVENDLVMTHVSTAQGAAPGTTDYTYEYDLTNLTSLTSGTTYKYVVVAKCWKAQLKSGDRTCAVDCWNQP